MSDSLVKYYRMKAAYEDKLAKKKKTIVMDPTLDPAEKRRRLARVTGKCVACKNAGGMRFERRGTKLIAACAASPSCKFSMTVDRGSHENIREVEAGVAEEVRRLESEVIRTKLDLLFGYSSQADAVAHFEQLRPHLKETGERLEELRRQYWRTVTRAADAQSLRTAKAEMAISRQQLRDTAGDTPEDARQAASMFVDTIRPLADRIRRLKYARSAIRVEQREDPTEEVDVLELEPYTLEQLLVPGAGMEES